jgi:DNA invertase Pin-like site-specific DNA recombinase
MADVSIPSQRDLTRRFCEAEGWVVTTEFIEPGASATDDRRPAFQRMLDEAAGPERRFDIICVHAFSRFYRNGAEMELTIRKLRKHGVEVVSVTQLTGDDPSQELMRHYSLGSATRRQTTCDLQVQPAVRGAP